MVPRSGPSIFKPPHQGCATFKKTHFLRVSLSTLEQKVHICRGWLKPAAEDPLWLDSWVHTVRSERDGEVGWIAGKPYELDVVAHPYQPSLIGKLASLQ